MDRLVALQQPTQRRSPREVAPDRSPTCRKVLRQSTVEAVAAVQVLVAVLAPAVRRIEVAAGEVPVKGVRLCRHSSTQAVAPAATTAPTCSPSPEPAVLVEPVVQRQPSVRLATQALRLRVDKAAGAAVARSPQVSAVESVALVEHEVAAVVEAASVQTPESVVLAVLVVEGK